MMKILAVAAALTMSGAAIAQTDIAPAKSFEPASEKLAACSVKLGDTCTKPDYGTFAAWAPIQKTPLATDVAMGGPFEELPADMKMAGNTKFAKGDADWQFAGLDAKMSKDVTADTTIAMGGPLEEITPTRRAGYPACSASVTDSCIQLYERGVSGAGN